MIPALSRGDVAEVYGIRKASEGIGGVGCFVVEWVEGDGAVGAVFGHAVVGECVHAGHVFARAEFGGLGAAGVEDALEEEFTGVVDGDPLVGGGRDASDGVACFLEFIAVAAEVEVALGYVVRADAEGAAPEAGVTLAQDVDVV